MSQEELKKECAKAFVEGNKQDAERLLPLIRQRDIVKIAVSSRLLHHATRHGWLDIVIELATKYKCDVHSKIQPAEAKQCSECRPLLILLGVSTIYLRELARAETASKLFCAIF